MGMYIIYVCTMCVYIYTCRYVHCTNTTCVYEYVILCVCFFMIICVQKYNEFKWRTAWPDKWKAHGSQPVPKKHGLNSIGDRTNKNTIYSDKWCEIDRLLDLYIICVYEFFAQGRVYVHVCRYIDIPWYSISFCDPLIGAMIFPQSVCITIACK
jgi:hypothetical protein